MTRTLRIRHGDEVRVVRISTLESPSGGETAAVVDGCEGVFEIAAAGHGLCRIVRDGRGVPAFVAARGDRRWVFIEGEIYDLQLVPEAGSGRRREGVLHEALTAPMPATVIAVGAAPGAAVRMGETLVVLEAMKMELPIRAPRDGTVHAIHCRAGDRAEPGAVLVELE